MRMSADTNKVGFFYESGTFGSVSGTAYAIGQVQESAISESFEREQVRFLGGGRSVAQQVKTVEEYEGTLTYYPQDFKMWMFALGSVCDAAAGNVYSHTISMTENSAGNAFTSGTNTPFISFSVEDVQGETANKVFRRVVNGCMIDSMSISAGEGAILECEANYIGQSLVLGSNVGSSVTVSTSRPLVWSDTKIHIPSGTVVNEIKEWALTVNNNLITEHYANGSRCITTPLPGNREIEFTATMDSNSTNTGSYYDQYFKGGSEFNMMVEIIDTDAGTGSRTCYFVLSGCQITEMDSPTKVEGIDENALTVNASGIIMNVIDTTVQYKAF